MNARDALEVVRQQLETLRNLVPDIEADSLADTAIAALTNLVERAGEPVAWMRIWAFLDVDVMKLPRKDRPTGWQLIATSRDKLLYDDMPLYAIPPTAPGASHER